MKGVTRAATVVLLLVVVVCVLVWMLGGPAASNAMVGNANVVGGIAGLLALVLVVAPWLRGAAGRRASMAPATTAIGGQAAAHLAAETLRYWQAQAKDRRITTPAPVTVRWCWANDEVAVPAPQLLSRTEVLTAGVITRLREQLFDRLDAEQTRIVLLGQAGAGKTAAMLLLLIDILRHRATGSPEPVPVWLTLGGWNPSTTGLRDWAAATLTRDYPGLAAPEYGGAGAAAHLIRTGQIALFLDGLDEMPPAAQGAALAAIDRDATGLRVVLTSRPDQYRTALDQGRLYAAAVIELLPVEVEQAQRFLLAEQLGGRRHAWQQVIDHLRAHPDSPAAHTLTTPLSLSLARETYTDPTANPTDLLNTDHYPTPETLLRHLLARSLTLAYPDPNQRAHATQWLAWIAQHLGTDRDLRWWDIPTWTPRWQRTLTLGLAVGLASGLAFGLTVGLTVGLTIGLTIGLREVVWSTPLATVRTASPLEVYRADRRRSVTTGLIVGLMLGLAAGLAAGFGPALQLAVVEAIWGLRRRRVRFMALLQTALDRQVLRQAGAVYQFRHAALQDLLAAHDLTTPAAEPRLTSEPTTRG